MPHQADLLLKALSTLFARVLFLCLFLDTFDVSGLHVAVELVKTNKALVTDPASKGLECDVVIISLDDSLLLLLFANPSLQMSGQVAFHSPSLVADLAGEWPLPSVNHEVPPEYSLRLEAFIALVNANIISLGVPVL